MVTFPPIGVTLTVGVLAAIVMIEAIGWQIIGERSFATTTMVMLLLIGLALPILTLRRDRRKQDHDPRVLVMVSVDRVLIRIPGAR